MNLEALAITALFLAAIPALMFLWNLPQLKSLRCDLGQAEKSLLQPISVLIPARNEAANIHAALTSVLKNQGVEFEIIVLDDHSEDGTARLVREFATKDSRVRLESAPPLPAGWCGKQHACHVLSQYANNSLLVFMDADVRLAPDALARMSAFMGGGSIANRESRIADGPALASGVPRQLTGTFLEKLLIPLIHFVLLGFLPVWRMRRCTKPAYGAGCGQLFIARAEAYRVAAGHATIRESLHDGLKLPRIFRRAGYKTDMFDATDVASCRMYQSSMEVVDGLTKNAHEGLAAPAQIGPWTVLLFGGQVLPWMLLASSPWLGTKVFGLALAGSALTLLPRALAAWRFRQAFLGVVLHPVAVTLFLAVQWRAFLRSFRNQPQIWKGRRYSAEPKLVNAPPPAVRINPNRNYLLQIVLCCVCILACSAARAATNSTKTAADSTELCAQFTLKDQFQVTHQFEFPRDKPTVLTVADKKGANDIVGWAHPIAEKFGGKIIIAGLADVSSVPGPLRSLVVSKFKKAIHYPVMLDWEGNATSSFNYTKGKANVYLVSKDGRILLHLAGKADAEKLKQLMELVGRETP